MALGGHLVPGNLVALCRECNNRKLDQHPAYFYTQDELERLQPLLDAQRDLFSFSFNLDRWEQNREAYLLELGIAPEIVQAALKEEDFVGYVGTGENRLCVTIAVDNRSLQPETLT